MTPPLSAAMSNYTYPSVADRSKTSDELFITCRKPAADASRHGRDRSRILLCSAAGAGVFKFRGFRPALAHILNDEATPRRSARFFNSTCIVTFQVANTAGGKRRARKRQRRRGGKQKRHRSKQSKHVAIHEPVPRLALIESVYHSNQGWQPILDRAALASNLRPGSDRRAANGCARPRTIRPRRPPSPRRWPGPH